MENFSPNVQGQGGSSAQVSDNNSTSNSTPGGINVPTSNGLSNSTAAAFAAALEAERPPPSWQLDLIMEKLRQKCSQLKPLGETAKNIRMALAERRCFLDQNDRVHFQKCLDSLQQSIKVNSLQSMVERLEMVSRQLGLKFTPGATGNEWFISSDMFYLELLIDPMGIVQEVKIQHDGKTEQQNVPEMVDCLRINDFVDFTAHLEGLVAIYQLNADKKIKSKAFIALQALEADLAALSNTYSHFTDGETIVMKSLFGLFQPRKGGHPVKLTYFISPYEFLDTTSKVTLPTDVQTIVERKLGTVAIVSIQASTSRKLQMSSTVTITKSPDGKNVPSYGTLNATNSTALPACFTVNLGKPIPVCKELLHAIEKTTGIHCFDFSNPQPILNLVTQHSSNGTLDCSNNRGLFVALPDTPNTLQVHCYFMTETPNLEGIMASSISFTLASQLPQIIAILRQQVIFNTLVGSCIRVGCKPDMDCMVFEVNALSHQNVSVSFQHPLEDSLVTLEFDLRDVSHPQCRLHTVTNVADIIPTLEEHACKVVQRSLSIPITVRAVIRRWQTMKSKYEPPNPEFNIPVGGSQFSDQLQSNEISCGAESERVQQQQQQQQSSTQQNPMVPGVVMSLSNNNNNNNSTTGNINNNNNANMSSTTTATTPTTMTALPSTTTTTAVQNNSSATPPSSSSGRHPSGSSSSSYTISPVHSSSSTPTTSTATGTNFSTPQQQQSQNQNQQQTPMELLSSYMNPLFSLSNQLGMSANLSGLTLQNLQNLSSLSPNMALQMSMLAQQMQNSNQKTTPSMLIGLLDQVGQRGRRRKRKGTSDSATQNQSGGPPTSLNIQQQQGNVNVPRPSPSPSPKSPRAMLPNKSPKRRPSEGSDISDTSQSDNSRAPTPQTPLTPRADGSNSNNAINLLMSEIGLDVPDPRWNIDITPVGNSGTSGQSHVSQTMENFLASKLLSGFGSAAANNNNNNNSNSTNNQNNTNSSNTTSGSEFQIENLDSDMEIDTATDIGLPGFMGNSNKFSIPKKMGKKSRDFPKRSISLDSHHSGNLDDHGGSGGGHLQSFMNQNSGSGNSGGNTGDGSTNADFKPLVTPSLSITPVSTNSSMGQTTVNSLLAAIRPGIEIIPLPNPVQIPNSITVTPIHPKPTMMQQLVEKKGNSNNNNNNSSGSNSGSGQKDKKNEDGSGNNNNSIGSSSNSNATDGSGSNLPKKKSSNLGSGGVGSDGIKKERKRKAASMMASLLDEDGHPIQDFNSGGGSNKQPKLLGPFGSVSSSSSSSSSGNSFVPIGDKKSGSGMSVSIKNASPPFGGLNLKKPGSPSLNRAPSSKSNSPTPKIGGKPSVSTLKSVSGSPKYPDVTSIQQQSSASFKAKLNKERKGGNFQGNPKIAKNLCMVGNQSGGVSNMLPTLKSMNESGGLTLANLNPSLLGLSGNARQDGNLADIMKVMSKGGVMESKGQIQQQQGQTSATPSQHLLAQTAAAQIQRSNSTGSSSGSSGNCNSSGGSSNSGSAAGGAAGIPGKKAGGGLLAVIDKLKSQHSVDDTSKKDMNMSNKDYLKASSAITSDVMQLTGQQQQGKKNGGGSNNNNNGSGSSGNTSGGTGGTGTTNSGQQGTNNNGGANNPEYMVKPGGQGLKMTLGKTKSSKDLGSLSGSKFKHGGLKAALSSKKGLLKMPNLSSSTLSTSQSSSTSMAKLGLAGLGTGSTLKKSSIGSQGGAGGMKNASDKDSGSSAAEKKSSKSSQLSSGGGSSSSTGANGGSNSSSSAAGNKSRPEDELDVTRKLFYDNTKFDLTKYQIPKKSSNSNSNNNGSSTTSAPASGTNNDNSPKQSASSSPSGSSSATANTTGASGGGSSANKSSSDKDSTPITTTTKADVEKITSSDSAGFSVGQSDNSKDGTSSYFVATAKEKDNLMSASLSSSQNQATTTSLVDLPSTSSGSILISSSAVESKLSSSSSGANSLSQNPSSLSGQSESTKIKLSSASIGSSEIPFLEEMNKYLSSKASSSFSSSVSSPMNLSQPHLLSSQNQSSSLSSSNQSTNQNQQSKLRGSGNDAVSTTTSTTTTPTANVSFGEPDSTTNEMTASTGADPTTHISNPLSTVNSSDRAGDKDKMMDEVKSTVATTTKTTTTTTIPGLEDSTSSDRNTPSNRAITSSPTSSSSNSNNKGGVSSIQEDYISPESPDPLNCCQDDNIYKNTLTIPTTPKQTNPLPTLAEAQASAALQSSPMTPDDDDQLIIDVAGCEAALDKKSTTTTPASGEASLSSSSTSQNITSSSAAAAVSSGNVKANSSGPGSGNSANISTDIDSLTKEASSHETSSSIVSESISMPPPDPPAKDEFGQESRSTRPPAPARSPRVTPILKSTEHALSSSSATTKDSGLGNSLITSPASPAAAGSTGSPSPNVATASIIAASPGPVPSPSVPVASTATVPIVSVHIVHSPQPNSPALLRSPLVVQSPHSSHPSPYAIDDDLMDEALIGTGK